MDFKHPEKFLYYTLKHKHIEYSKQIIELYRQHLSLNRILVDSCNNGWLEIIEYLFTLPNHNILINYGYNLPFYNACSKGYIDIVKFLLSLLNNDIDLNIFDDTLFSCLCIKGHLNIIQYILSISNPNNLDTILNKSFKYACEFKQINIIRYLFV